LKEEEAADQLQRGKCLGPDVLGKKHGTRLPMKNNGRVREGGATRLQKGEKGNHDSVPGNRLFDFKEKMGVARNASWGKAADGRCREGGEKYMSGGGKRKRTIQRTPG